MPSLKNVATLRWVRPCGQCNRTEHCDCKTNNWSQQTIKRAIKATYSLHLLISYLRTFTNCIVTNIIAAISFNIKIFNYLCKIGKLKNSKHTLLYNSLSVSSCAVYWWGNDFSSTNLRPVLITLSTSDLISLNIW